MLSNHEMLTPYIEQVHTITFDNGGEFAEHKADRGSAGCRDLLCAPLLFVERGLNENSNGLLRQLVPKGNRPERGHGRGCQESEQWLNRSTSGKGRCSSLDSGSLSTALKSTVRRE